MTQQQQQQAAEGSRALEKPRELPPWAVEVVQPYLNADRYELLLPAIPINSALGFGHVPSLSLVAISPNPLDGEVFKVGSKSIGGKFVDVFAYAKPALLKFASAAGISINAQRVDRGTDRDYCEVKAFGAMKNESGQAIMRSATKAFHMADVSAEAWRVRQKRNESYSPEKRKSEAVLREEHEAEMTAFRKHIVRRTEAGAITAVIRELLGVKGGLTREQIAKPKVILRVDFRPDANDPDVKRFLLERADSAALALYRLQAGEATKTHLGSAEVVDDPEPAAALPTSEAPRPAPEPEQDYAEMVVRGFEALAVTPTERARILTQSAGDMRRAYELLNELANAEQ